MAKRLILKEPHGAMVVEDYEPTPPSQSQVQVRNLATTINHLDWTRIDKNLFIPSFPHVFGMDIAGEVVSSRSDTLKEGDLVLAPGRVGNSDSCSFQTHVLVHETHCAKIDSHVPLSQACTIPFSLATGACGLYLALGLRREVDRSTNQSVLIWGANGGVGKLAVQLARLSGYRVVAVVSDESAVSAVQARGADTILVKGDPDIVSKIQAAAPELCYAFDTVVSVETVSQILQTLKRPATLATAIKYLGHPVEGVSVVPVFSGEIMGTTMMGAPSAAGADLGTWLWGKLGTWLRESKITPLESTHIGGLESVQGGLDHMRKGTAQVKLVVSIP